MIGTKLHGTIGAGRRRARRWLEDFSYGRALSEGGSGKDGEHDDVTGDTSRSTSALKVIAISMWALAAVMALAAVGAESALAQGANPEGDAIFNTLSNVRDYISGLLLVLGGIGFVVSLGVKAVAATNENAQALANFGMKGSLIAVLAGAIVNPIMRIVEGLAAGGGGGG